MAFLMYSFFIFLTLNLLGDNNYVLKVWNKNDYAVLRTLRDDKVHRRKMGSATFLYVEAVTLNIA